MHARNAPPRNMGWPLRIPQRRGPTHSPRPGRAVPKTADKEALGEAEPDRIVRAGFAAADVPDPIPLSTSRIPPPLQLSGWSSGAARRRPQRQHRGLRRAQHLPVVGDAVHARFARRSDARRLRPRPPPAAGRPQNTGAASHPNEAVAGPRDERLRRGHVQARSRSSETALPIPSHPEHPLRRRPTSTGRTRPSSVPGPSPCVPHVNPQPEGAAKPIAPTSAPPRRWAALSPAGLLPHVVLRNG